MNDPTVIITKGMKNGRPYTLTRGPKCWVKSFDAPGSEPTDETSTHPRFGQINVSRIMRAINRHEIEPQGVEFPIDESWQRVAREADINPARLARITDDECSPGNPLILIRTKSGDPILVDGVHRLRYMVDHGWPTAIGVLLTFEQAERFRMVMMTSHDHGKTWKEMDYGAVMSDFRGAFPQYDQTGRRNFYSKVK